MRESAYEIEREPGLVKFSGIARLSSKLDYVETLAELRAAAEEAPDILEIDCTRLKFLNSGGISILAVFVQTVRDESICKRLRFATNSSEHEWQARWVRNLGKLWSGVQIVDRTH